MTELPVSEKELDIAQSLPVTIAFSSEKYIGIVRLRERRKTLGIGRRRRTGCQFVLRRSATSGIKGVARVESWLFRSRRRRAESHAGSLLS